jgi:Ca2+-binding EF-hand superfamily protein
MFTGESAVRYQKLTTDFVGGTGVVVENFSYIYQQRRNQTLNREEMRAFKKVWAQFDQSSTGYLDRNKIVPFLAVRPFLPFSIPPP